MITHAVDSTHAIVTDHVRGKCLLEIVQIATGRTLTIEGQTLADVRAMVRKRPVSWFVRVFGAMPYATWFPVYKPHLQWTVTP